MKVFANRCLAFDRGERDNHGMLIQVKTTLGFCELPDWVAKTEYYQMAIKDKSIQTFNASSESEEVLKLSEQAEKLKMEIRALEEKKELLSPKEIVETAVEAKLNPPVYREEGNAPAAPDATVAMPVIFNDTRKGSDKLESTVEVERTSTIPAKKR